MTQKSGKSKTSLIVGVVAAVVILAVLLVILLTQCTGREAAAPTTVTTQPAATESDGYSLYWNLDRAEYDGKSEAGMSSRKPESDGYFHVRFFKDGETLELRVADRKIVNQIDVNDLMDLVFDENGIVVGIIPSEKLPIEPVGWKFYVQSTGGNVIKLNSSRTFNGLEVVLEIGEQTHIYDMTGAEGEVGKEIMPTNLDRVIAVADMEGNLTHVFVIDRSEYMNSFEAECQHCGKTVTWSAWTKTNEMPTYSGHYQLQADIKLNAQPQQNEDAKICIDLNGVRVDGANGARCYAMFNPGAELAIMDTSEDQSGVIAPHGTGHQGMGVWVRYGAFYFYGGTIDGSDATNEIYGTSVSVQKNAYMYMFGGTIIGGKAGCVYDGKVYKRGLGGTMGIEGKLVLNGGTIRDGYAEAMISWDSKGQRVYNRGIGGNLYVMGSGVVEINGGVIENGKADGVGGNIYLDGTSELIMNDGLISGGTIKGRGKNGGSIYVGGKATFVMNGGCIRGGVSRNEGGCVYAGGKFTMNGGYIGGGRVYDYKTGKLKEDCASRNVFVVNNQFSMYGGKIEGGVHAIDSSATDNKQAVVALGGYAVIDGGENSKNNLFINTAGSGVKVFVGNMLDGSYVRVHATTGIFTQPTKEENVDNFASDIPGAEVIYYDGQLALGKLGCICAHETHIGQCDGTQRLWLPYTKNNALPMTTGYWFLTEDVALAGQQKLAGAQQTALDLNGKQVTGGMRAIIILEDSSLLLTDSTGGASLASKGYNNDSGAVIMVGDGEAEIYGGTLRQLADDTIKVSGGGVVRVDANGVLNLYDGTLMGGKVTGVGGNIRTNGIVNIYGGTITGGQAVNGGNIGLNAGTVNLYGGTIEKGKATNGGNIFLSKGTELNLPEGSPVITAGEMAVSTGGNGGNIYAETGSTITMNCGSITNGKALRDSAGNVYLKGKMTMTGGEISGGHRNNGGSLDKRNLFCVNGDLTVTGGKLLGGVCVYGASTRLKVGGSAYIVSNESGKASLTLSAGAMIEVKEALNGSASILVSNAVDTRIAASGTDAFKKVVRSDKGLQVSLETGGVYLRAGDAHIHCLCARTDGTHADGCDGKDVIFAPWTETNALPDTGAYYLVNNVELEKQAWIGQQSDSVAEHLQLCLHGRTVQTKSTATERVIMVWTTSRLSLTDCGSGGTVRAGSKVAMSGGVVYVGGTFDLFDGTITGGRITSGSGGNVYVAGTMNMAGGQISDGAMVGRDGAGNLDVRGTLNMSGGQISGGCRTDANGNVVALSLVKRNIFTNNATVNMSGGSIDGGVQLYGSTRLTVSGNAQIVSSDAEKPSLTMAQPMVVGELGQQAAFRISGWAKDTAFATGTLTDGVQMCFSHDSGYTVALEGNQLLFR